MRKSNREWVSRIKDTGFIPEADRVDRAGEEPMCDYVRTAKDQLLAALDDEPANVVTVAAEALYNMGEKEAAKRAFLSILEDPNPFARCHALNAIDCVNEESSEIVEGLPW